MKTMRIMLMATMIVGLACPRAADAQDIAYGLAARDPASLPAGPIARIAHDLLERQQADRSLDKAVVELLPLAAGDIQGAATAFRDLPCSISSDPADARRCFLGIFALARRDSLAGQRPFATAFRAQLTARAGSLDDRAQERLFAWLRNRASQARSELEGLLGRLAGADRIAIDDAIALIRAHVVFEATRATQPEIDAFIAAERARRYDLSEPFLISTPQGASLAATLVRPRDAKQPLTTAMLFTIYSDPSRNLEIAAMAATHGYAGLVVNARGKLESPDPIQPYEVERLDTVAAIEWASRQPWSDGRVGMYGGSYSGFAAWSATKRLPDALKTIVPYVAAIPGQGLPMENNIFFNANYGWAFYVTNNRSLDRETYNDSERWSALNDRWYESGRRYRDIDRVDGTPNPWLQRWLEHPSYDEYWQAMVPYGSEFARIGIPVLTITGYYDDGQISALRYLQEHFRHRPDAEHYLVIGPYDHFGTQQQFKAMELRGYALDPVAQFDTTALTFSWFDHIFKGAPRPAIVEDRINYQVMGTNRWRHAPSLAAMHDELRVLYLTDSASDGRLALSPARPARPGSIPQVVDTGDRNTTSAGYYPFPILDPAPDFSNGIVFQSKPLERGIELSGSFSGVLRARVNKRDFDFMVALYELRPDGSTFALSYYMGRASYVRDIAKRQLLTPGAANELPFDRTRMVSRRIEPGSRILVVVDVIKNGFHQVNHGTGGDVSDETVADAGAPLQIEWQTDSFIRLPVANIDDD